MGGLLVVCLSGYSCSETSTANVCVSLPSYYLIFLTLLSLTFGEYA